TPRELACRTSESTATADRPALRSPGCPRRDARGDEIGHERRRAPTPAPPRTTSATLDAGPPASPAPPTPASRSRGAGTPRPGPPGCAGVYERDRRRSVGLPGSPMCSASRPVGDPGPAPEGTHLLGAGEAEASPRRRGRRSRGPPRPREDEDLPPPRAVARCWSQPNSPRRGTTR